MVILLPSIVMGNSIRAKALDEDIGKAVNRGIGDYIWIMDCQITGCNPIIYGAGLLMMTRFCETSLVLLLHRNAKTND